MREHRLFAKRSKCSFGEEKVEYLGHFVGQGTRWMDPAKVSAVTSWHPPRTIKELQSFLGMANYYNAYVAGFATLATPLTDLLQASRVWV